MILRTFEANGAERLGARLPFGQCACSASARTARFDSSSGRRADRCPSRPGVTVGASASSAISIWRATAIGAAGGAMSSVIWQQASGDVSTSSSGEDNFAMSFSEVLHLRPPLLRELSDQRLPEQSSSVRDFKSAASTMARLLAVSSAIRQAGRLILFRSSRASSKAGIRRQEIDRLQGRRSFFSDLAAGCALRRLGRRLLRCPRPYRPQVLARQSFTTEVLQTLRHVRDRCFSGSSCGAFFGRRQFQRVRLRAAR